MTLALLVAFSAFAGATAQAQVVNGSLTGPISNGGVPPSWTLLAGSPDTMDAGNNVGVVGLQGFGAVPSATPNGGTWVGMGSDVTPPVSLNSNARSILKKSPLEAPGDHAL